MPRVMSETEIRHRKKVQGKISQATGALGLTALGGTLLATKRGGRLSTKVAHSLGKPRPKVLAPETLKEKTAPILATSAGLGGVGSFNFAAYTGAEGRKKKPAMPTVAKSAGVEPPYVGEVAKEWKPSASTFDSERARMKRSQAYEDVGTVGAGALTAGAAAKGAQALKAVSPNWKKGQKKARRLPNVARAQAARRATAVGHGKVGAALGGAAALTAGGTLAIKDRNKARSWAPYAKRDSVSAFGVDHGEVSKARTAAQEEAFRANRARTKRVAGTAGAAYLATGGAFGRAVHRHGKAVAEHKAAMRHGNLESVAASSKKIAAAGKQVKGRGTLFLGTTALGAGAMAGLGHANTKRYARASRR